MVTHATRSLGYCSGADRPLVWPQNLSDINAVVITNALLTKVTPTNQDVVSMDTVLTPYIGMTLPKRMDIDHLRDTIHPLIFCRASDGVAAQFGFDLSGCCATGHFIFTLEYRLNYFQKVKRDTQVKARTRLLGHGIKCQLHLGQQRTNSDASRWSESSSGGVRQTRAGTLQSLAYLPLDLPAPLHVDQVLRLLPDKL